VTTSSDFKDARPNVNSQSEVSNAVSHNVSATDNNDCASDRSDPIRSPKGKSPVCTRGRFLIASLPVGPTRQMTELLYSIYSAGDSSANASPHVMPDCLPCLVNSQVPAGYLETCFMLHRLNAPEMDSLRMDSTKLSP
jgi:hypothetical protein